MTNRGAPAIINELFGGTGVRQRTAKKISKEIKKDLTNNEESDIIAKLLTNTKLSEVSTKKNFKKIEKVLDKLKRVW